MQFRGPPAQPDSHNIFVQLIFTPLTVNTGKTQYFIDEFGIVLPLIMLAFGVYFWTRRKDLTIFSDLMSLDC